MKRLPHSLAVLAAKTRDALSGTVAPFPHEGGCPTCRDLGRCNACGEPAVPHARCTNGRCRTCHNAVCTPGGITGPGHGFGRVGGPHFRPEGASCDR